MNFISLSEKCPFCDSAPTSSSTWGHQGKRINCPICKEYCLDEKTIYIVFERNDYFSRTQKALISGFIRNQYEQTGREVIIRDIDFVLATASFPETPLESIDKILLFLHKQSKNSAAAIPLNPQTDYPIAYAKDDYEFTFFLETALQLGYLEQPGPSGKYRITIPKGWQRLDELRRTGKDSNQAFVAMSFNPTLNDIWLNGFKPALEDDTGWKSIRMDALEHNERIDDRMLAEIRKSGLLIADLTKHRQNVYFEAGFAMGLGIPVIYTCREDEKNQVHFDTRQYKYIPWTNAADLRKQLRERIEATGLAKTLKAQA